VKIQYFSLGLLKEFSCHLLSLGRDEFRRYGAGYPQLLRLVSVFSSFIMFIQMFVFSPFMGFFRCTAVCSAPLLWLHGFYGAKDIKTVIALGT